MIDSFFTSEELNNIGFKSIGKNVKISRYSRIYHPESISIGNNVRIDDFCYIVGGKEIIIHDYIHIPSQCILNGYGGIEIHDFSGLSYGVRLISASDDYSGKSLTNPLIPDKFKKISLGRIVLEKHVLIGTNSVVLPNVVMREGTSVGAMTLIKKDTDAWSIYVGIPSKKIAERSKEILKIEDNFLRDSKKILD